MLKIPQASFESTLAKNNIERKVVPEINDCSIKDKVRVLCRGLKNFDFMVPRPSVTLGAEVARCASDTKQISGAVVSIFDEYCSGKHDKQGLHVACRLKQAHFCAL